MRKLPTWFNPRQLLLPATVREIRQQRRMTMQVRLVALPMAAPMRTPELGRKSRLPVQQPRPMREMVTMATASTMEHRARAVMLDELMDPELTPQQQWALQKLSSRDKVRQQRREQAKAEALARKAKQAHRQYLQPKPLAVAVHLALLFPQ